MKFEFKEEIVRKCLDKLGYGIETLKPDTAMLLSYDQYLKYIEDYEGGSGSLMLDMQKEMGIGFVIEAAWGKTQNKWGKVVYFETMRGHKVLFDPKVDIHLKVVDKENILFFLK